MLTIVSAYQGQARYVEAARAYPQEDLQALWNRYVIDAYWEQWAAGEFNEVRTRKELSSPIRDLDRLEHAAQLLAAAKVEAIVAQAYERIASLLPYHDGPTAICVMAASPGDRDLIQRNNGVVGACIGGNTLLTIDPAGQDWTAWIPYVLAHERHHSAWGYHYHFVKHGAGGNLLYGLVSEGAADSFAHLVYPGLKPTWVNALSQEEEARQWEQMRALLRAPDPEDALHRRFFFGSAEQNTPQWSGYTIGFHIVQGYLQAHPGESIFEWLDHDPEKILRESGYPGSREITQLS